MRTIHSMVSAVVVATLVLVASYAQAQACLGYPLGAGSTAVVGAASFPDGANSFGVGIAHKATESASFGAYYSATTFDDIFGFEVPTMHSVGATGAYEVHLVTSDTAPALSLCPNVGFEYGRWDEINILIAPLGFAIGASIPIADNTAILTPYVNPQFFWSRASIDGESETDTDFGFTAGASVRVSNLLFGPRISKIADGKATFGLMAGYVF